MYSGQITVARSRVRAQEFVHSHLIILFVQEYEVQYAFPKHFLSFKWVTMTIYLLSIYSLYLLT